MVGDRGLLSGILFGVGAVKNAGWQRALRGARAAGGVASLRRN